MFIKTMRAPDGRFIGCNVFEIVSLPPYPENPVAAKEARSGNSGIFLQLVNELHKLCAPENTVAELLWVTEKTESQTFKSKLHIYCVLRDIGVSEEAVNARLERLQNHCVNFLASGKFNVKKISFDDDVFLNAVRSVDSSCLHSIIKSEKCNANSGSLGFYNYFDVIASDNEDNFLNLASSLSLSENCAVSFQIIPSTYSQPEAVVINETAAQYVKIAGGFQIERTLYKDSSAAEPARAFSYYSDRIRQPVFKYNILVFGSKPVCGGISAKIISLLQAGKTQIVNSDFHCLDLTGEKISLFSMFLFYPWNVNTKLLSAVLAGSKKSPAAVSPVKRLPYLITSQEATSFFRLPMHEKAMSFLKSNQGTKSNEQFDSAVIDKNNIRIGFLKSSENAEVPIGCPEQSFTKHALIVGTPGSGKTNFSISLLMQFAQRGIPFLAIEPTKREYRSLIDAVPDLRVFTPGNNDISPFIINPFIPPKGIRIEQYIPSLASAFNAAFSMPEPLDIIFLKAVRSCYSSYGWKDYSKIGDPDVTVFGLHEFILTFKKLIEKTDYSAEVKGNIKSGGLLRLSNLIEQNSNIYDTINTVPIEDILSGSTVIELDGIDNAEQKSLLMALLLINICIYTKHNHLGDGKLKNIILIDEAHVLLGGKHTGGDGAESEETTVKALQNMIAEIRSYGTSIVIADQSPTKVSREVVANTDIKVTFRLVQASEKEMIIDSTNMDEEDGKQLSRLKPGEAFIYYSKLEAPQLVITEEIRGNKKIRQNVGDEEIAQRNTYWRGRANLLKPFAECGLFESCKDGCDFVIRAKADYYANKLFVSFRNKITDSEALKKFLCGMPKLLENQLKDEDEAARARTTNCVKIRFLRKMQLEESVTLNSGDIKSVMLFKGGK